MNASPGLAISPFTMPAALAAADEILGNPVWTGNRDHAEQVAWLESFRRRAAVASQMPELHRHASLSAEDHVAWLSLEGWDAQITQGSPGDVFLAATLNLVARWLQPGRAYQADGVDRVLLAKGAYVSPSSPGEHPVVEVVTQTQGFHFCFQQVDAPPASAGELLDHALGMASRSASTEVYLDFPMVDLRVRNDAGYMLGLHAGVNVVTQAAEQLRLELNEIGGRASAAAEIAVTRGIPTVETIEITGPFVVAISRQGVPRDQDKVVFAAYCDRGVWKAPAAGRI